MATTRSLFFVFVFLFCWSCASAGDFRYPALKQHGKYLNDFVPKSWRVLTTVTGDLNSDKLQDIAAVVESPTDLNAQQEEDSFSQPHKPRIFFVLFGQKQGGYTLSVQSNDLISCADEGGVLGDPFQKISIDRGSVLIHHAGGNAWRWEVTARFRFQKGNWCLIGLTDLSYHTGSGEMTKYDYNLLTGKMEVTKGTMGSAKNRVTWQTPGKRTVTLTGFRTWFDGPWLEIADHG